MSLGATPITCLEVRQVDGFSLRRLWHSRSARRGYVRGLGVRITYESRVRSVFSFVCRSLTFLVIASFRDAWACNYTWGLPRPAAFVTLHELKPDFRGSFWGPQLFKTAQPCNNCSKNGPQQLPQNWGHATKAAVNPKYTSITPNNTPIFIQAVFNDIF